MHSNNENPLSRGRFLFTKELGLVVVAVCALHQASLWVRREASGGLQGVEQRRSLQLLEGDRPPLCPAHLELTPRPGIPLQFGPEWIFDPTATPPNYDSTPAVRARQRGYHSWHIVDVPAIGQHALTPLVSVIVPYYNAHEFLDDTLLSLKAQTLKRFEIVLVNDISTDIDAINKLHELKANNRDPRLRILEAPRKLGLSGARNYGVQQSRSDFVFWCDPDDLIEPTALEKMYWFLQAYSMYSWVGAFTVGFGEKDYLWKKNFQFGDAVLNLNVAHVAALVRKSHHLEIGGFDESVKVFEDWDYWINMANHGHWGYTIPEYLCWYRNKITSLVAEGDAEGWRGMDRSTFSKSLQEKYPNAFANFPEPLVPKTYEQGLEFNLKSIDNEMEQKLENYSSSFSSPDPVTVADSGLDSIEFSVKEAAQSKRIMLMIPWMKPGGADEINLAITEQMKNRHGWEITIVGTAILKEQEENEMLSSWRHLDSCGGLSPRFQRFTDDIFCVSAFLTLVSIPPFVSYLFRTRQPSVVLISHSELGYRLLPWMRMSFPETHFVDLIHIVERNWKSGGYPFFSVLFSSLLDQTITISNQLKNWLIQKGVESSKISVYYFVYELVDCFFEQVVSRDQRKEIRSKYGLSEEDFVIIFVGRFVLQKRPELVLKIAESISKDSGVKMHPWKIIMIGDGPRMAPIKKKYESKSFAKVRQHLVLLGNTPHMDTMALLKVSDAFLLPSENEGISIATAEAMSYGLTIVCSDVGAQSELVQPSHGYLVPFEESSDREIKEYIRVISDIIKNPTKGATMGKAARSHVCSYETQSLLPYFCNAAKDRMNSKEIDVDFMISLNTYFSFEDFKMARATEDYFQHLERKKGS
mmetsp:Transcript_14106/g.18487  ORF Transcript_14106/g.18487 Transcript_14106/m.18487 type:complete len:867 (-) Transcript_14106:44-2644(-)